MFYVRKLNTPSSLKKLQNIKDINELEADVVGREVKTQGNVLSFWKCDNLSKPEDAVKAILLASNKIVAMQFIIITDSILKTHNLTMNECDEGVTAYKKNEKFHANMVVLNYGKMADVLRAFCDIVVTENCVLKVTSDKAIEYVKEVIRDNLLDIPMLETNSEPNFKALKKHLEELELIPNQ